MKVGFVGLGIMGKPMATHLIEDGFEMYLLNYKGRAEPLTALGGHSCGTYRELAEICDVIITMLPSAPHLADVLFSEDGIAKHGKPGAVVIDMSSIAPEEARRFSGQLNERGLFMMDAPVSGGEPMAIEGQLSIMVGGAEEHFGRFLPLFQSMGKTVTHVGTNGAGATVKLANQILVSTHLAALSEAALFASKSGIDLTKMFEAVRGGLAGSAVLEAKLPKIVARNFEPGGRIDLNFKDLKNIQSTADALGLPLPVTSQVKEIFSAEMANGNAGLDHSGILRYFERVANFQVGNPDHTKDSGQ